MDTKAAFEKWLKEKMPTTYQHVFISEEDEMTNHFKASVLDMRTGWDASRNALEINIPATSDSEYWFEGTFQRMRYERDVEKVITSHGIRIKGKTE